MHYLNDTELGIKNTVISISTIRAELNDSQSEHNNRSTEQPSESKLSSIILVHNDMISSITQTIRLSKFLPNKHAIQTVWSNPFATCVLLKCGK